MVALTLFLIAASLEGRDIYQSLARPLPALWALCVSYGLLPALGWLAGQLLSVPDLRIGLLLIASVPCTLASAALWTRLAGGNDAMALLTVLLSTALSWLLTTAWLAFGTGAAVEIDTPTMMRGLTLVLIVPVGLGQLGRLARPLARLLDRYKARLAVVSLVLVLCIIVRAAVDARDKLEAGSALVDMATFLAMLALCLATHLLALTTGFWTSRLLRFTRQDQIAVAFSGSQKTLPVALYLFDAYFIKDYPLAVLPLIVYHVGQLLLDTLIAHRWAQPSTGSEGQKGLAEAKPFLGA